MVLYKTDNFADAYKFILKTIMEKAEFEIYPRGMKVKEIRDFSVEISNPLNNSFYNPIREMNFKYLAGELLWYFSGSNKLEFIEKYSKFWKKIANPDGTCVSSYGYLLFKEHIPHIFPYKTEWDWAYDSLIKDIDSRQAIIHFNKSHHMCDTKDFPCTLYGIFHIRENNLYFSIHMRSSDSIFGTTYDIPFFMILQQQMRLCLLDKYPTLGLGSFTYSSNSQHIYEKDFELVEQMLKHNFISDYIPELKETLLPRINNNFENSSVIDKFYDSIMKNEKIKYSGNDDFLSWMSVNL